MNKNQIELLAPAGNYDIFLLAIKAGADAVYFAGEKFGARAFATNFSNEEVIKAIHIAHLFEKKVYLTVNTLLKELEIQTLYDFLNSFYIEGLDGVIVQDLGVLKYIKTYFPEMEIHASTQMTITGSNGINFLESLNVHRVVLARELSLSEIKRIRKNTNMELEIFIHGAMCYAYSGQCLLSSILGGRSGNRGRCAQPCRLPYQIDKNPSNYPLSMKDQCAIYFLEDLVKIGVNSLKIEGRMKKPEYVGKVTLIYRKYLDIIYKKLEVNDNSPLIIEQNDINVLENLYVRTSSQNGYFENQNGPEMITMSQSTYKETSAKLLGEINSEIASLLPLRINLSCDIYVYVNKAIKLTITYNNKEYSFEGESVLLAKNQPLTEEKISNQIQKTKNTSFHFSKIHVHTDSQSFIPLSQINAIRRIALQEIENDILNSSKRKPNILQASKFEYSNSFEHKENKDLKKQYSVLISTLQQLETVLLYLPKRIYIPISLFELEQKKVMAMIQSKEKIEFFISLPHVFREKDLPIKEELWINILKNKDIQGVLIRNLEEVGFLEKIKYNGIKQLDYFIYCMNTFSINFWKTKNYKWTSPLELNKKELSHLPSATETMVYGHIPLMISANCISKTFDGCKKNKQEHILTDRMHKDFPVQKNCNYCYNLLYNCIPLSLHKYINSFNESMILRLEFSIESKNICKNICDYYFDEEPFSKNFFLKTEYTNGHFNRGVD